jgi:hypothetical protein
MIFKPMNPDDVRKALEGHQDVLTPAMEAVDNYFHNLSCPACGGECMRFVDPSGLYKEGALLPTFLARCKACGIEFEPYTKIQVSGPRPNKVTF